MPTVLVERSKRSPVANWRQRRVVDYRIIPCGKDVIDLSGDDTGAMHIALTIPATEDEEGESRGLLGLNPVGFGIAI